MQQSLLLLVVVAVCAADIIVYEHANFQGATRKYSNDVFWIGIAFNDKTTSIRVTGTDCWEIFMHASYQGVSEILRPGNYRSLLIGNDQLSSMKKRACAPPPAVHLGCYEDRGSRALNRFSVLNRQDMTVDLCLNMCAQRNMPLAAVQYSQECFCGYSGDAYNKYGEKDGCYAKCKGNNKQACGGGWRMNVFRIDSVVIYQHANFRGARKEFTKNTPSLPNFNDITSSVVVKGPACWKVFQHNSFQGQSSTLLPGKYTMAQMRMPNDIISSLKRVRCPVYLGCWQDRASRAVPNLFKSDSRMTVDFCIDHCASRGYVYAAVQNSIECFCGSSSTQYQKYGWGYGCNMPCKGNSNQRCGGSWHNNVYYVAGSAKKRSDIPSNVKPETTLDDLLKDLDI